MPKSTVRIAVITSLVAFGLGILVGAGIHLSTEKDDFYKKRLIPSEINNSYNDLATMYSAQQMLDYGKPELASHVLNQRIDERIGSLNLLVPHLKDHAEIKHNVEIILQQVAEHRTQFPLGQSN